MSPPRKLFLLPLLLAFLSVALFALYNLSDNGNSNKIEGIWSHSPSGTTSKAKAQEPVTSKPESDSNTPPKSPDAIPNQTPETDGCTEDITWLRKYNLTTQIEYTSREIITIPARASARPLFTEMKTPLLPEFSQVDLENEETFTPTPPPNVKEKDISKCPLPLTLEVPLGVEKPVDASHLIFGVQTSLNRLRDTKKHIARWLTDTGAHMYCIVVGDGPSASDSEMKELEAQFRKEGMLVTIIHPVRKSDSFPQRTFSLVNVLYEARFTQEAKDKEEAKEQKGNKLEPVEENRKPTEWLIVMDDDTFFPSMPNLLTMLSHHDPSKPAYIGSLSENWSAVQNYGLMGFGGAGIFLSVPLASTLAKYRHECGDEPLASSAGDVTIMNCIYRFTPVKLQHEPALHQMDFYGDQGGFYESGREMLSLHHWKIGNNGTEFAMDKMHLVADVCGWDCFLQRWSFPSQGLVLANGFSVVAYPLGNLTGGGVREGAGLLKGLEMGVKKVLGKSGEGKIDLLHMETTWGEEFDSTHALGPLRAKMTAEEKVSWRLLDAFKVGGGEGVKESVRQVYVNKGVGEGTKDSVIVLDWRAGDRIDGERIKRRTRVRGR